MCKFINAYRFREQMRERVTDHQFLHLRTEKSLDFHSSLQEQLKLHSRGIGAQGETTDKISRRLSVSPRRVYFQEN